MKLLAVGVWLVTVQVVASCVVTFGVSLSMTNGPVPGQQDRVTLGQYIRDGLLLWQENVGKVPVATKFGQNCTFNVTIWEDYGNTTLMLENYQQNLNNVDFFLGPQGSDFSVIAKSVVSEPAAKIMVATSAGATSFNHPGNYSFSILTPSSKAFVSTMPLILDKGAQTIAFVYEEDHPFTSGSCLSLPALATQYNLTVLGAFNITYAAGPLTSAQKQRAILAVNYTMGLNPDVLILCTFQSSGEEIVATMKQYDWVPQAVVISPFLAGWAQNENATFMYGHQEWVPGAAYEGDEHYGNSTRFTEMFFEKYNVTPNSYHAMGAVAPLILQLAVSNSSSLSSDDVRQQLERMDHQMFYGRIFYGADHSTLKDMLVVQLINGSLVPVAPAPAQQMDAIYPLPLWSQRS